MKHASNTIVGFLLYSAEIDWLEYKRSLKKAGQWNVEVY
jgi:ferredoxin--NADP+ reductase